MKRNIALAVAFVLATASCTQVKVNNQMTDPEVFRQTAPTQTGEYRVKVNGKEIPVYTAKAEYENGIYYFATFDFAKSAKVEVCSRASLEDAKILPEKYGLAPKHHGNARISFKAEEPFRVAVERDGKVMPLILFGNRPDQRPQRAENVIVMEAGYHDIPLTELTSGQTLYLAEGAVLRGAVHAEGDNITIAGKGIITGDGYEKWHGPASYPLHAENCRNLTVKDIIITNPWSWTFVMHNCGGVMMDNVKMCCSNILNDDAIDICNSSNVTIQHCFLRAQDDIFAIKGMNADGSGKCDNIRTESCEVWTDKANIYRIGYECDCEGMSNICGKDIDVLHYSRDYRIPSEYWANTIFWIQPSNGMMIEDCCFEDFRINASYNDIVMILARCCITSGPSMPGGAPYPEAGHARNISFKNITVTGDSSVFKGENAVEDYDDEHKVENLTMENIIYFGKQVR